MTDPIKARIQSLCPDIMEPSCSLHGKQQERYCSACGTENKITLAVVLRAIKEVRSHQLFAQSLDNSMRVREQRNKEDAELLRLWNLAKDDYDLQDEPTKKFIGTLLGVV